MRKAIETKYNGFRFRSRLEARWAVFFDKLGIKYNYEYEGFELSDGSKFLPDFYLPTFHGGDLWCEVKPFNGDFSKALLLCRDYDVRLWLCEDLPTYAIYKVYGRDWHNDTDDEFRFECGIPLYDQARDENRMFVQPCCYSDICRDDCGTEKSISLVDVQYYNPDFDTIYKSAVTSSRSARFEYGENG